MICYGELRYCQESIKNFEMNYLIVAFIVLIAIFLLPFFFKPKLRMVICPYPANKTFAFTIIDDTDGATLENIKPIYDYLSAIKLKTTKTIWIYEPDEVVTDERHKGDTVEHKDYLAYLKQLQQDGFEIALHNVSSQSNKRAKIIDGIEKFSQLFDHYPDINVSHEKNKENLYFDDYLDEGLKLKPFHSKFFLAAYNRLTRVRQRAKKQSPRAKQFFGEQQDSDYFWGDICREKIRYVRSYAFFQDINTLKVNPNIPYHDPSRPYVNRWFDSSNGQDCATFNQMLSEQNIEKLKKEGGCCILYTHFGKGFVNHANGSYELNGATKLQLKAIASDDAGWFAPVSTLLDRFQKIKNVHLFKSGKTIVVFNDNEEAIAELALNTVPNREFYDLDGRSIRSTANGKIILNKLEPRTAKILLLKKGFNNEMKMYWKDRDRLPVMVDLKTIVQKIRAKLC